MIRNYLIHKQTGAIFAAKIYDCKIIELWDSAGDISTEALRNWDFTDQLPLEPAHMFQALPISRAPHRIIKDVGVTPPSAYFDIVVE